jgi:hypothetical protein
MRAHGQERARAQGAARPGSGSSSSSSGSGGWRTGMTTGTQPSATEGGGQDIATLGRCWAGRPAGLSGVQKGRRELRVHGRISVHWATGLAGLRLQLV